MCKAKKSPRLPAERCAVCEKTLEETGGMRIVAQRLRGVGLSDKYQGGGNPDYPRQSVPLDDGSGTYLLVWGEKSKWTDAAIERARQAYLAGQQPWLCQLCAERKCRQCGSPINYPMGSDVIYDSGCSSHVAVFSFDPGCCNKNCKKYREWEWKT